MVTLTRQHLRLVYRVRGIYFARVPTAVIDDLISAGTWALLGAARRYQDRGASFETYATYRVRGAMRDHLRRQHLSLCPMPDDPPFAGPDPMGQWEQTEALESAIECLSAREQWVIRLIYLRGYNGREVAATLGVSAVTVSRINTTACQKLRPLLDREALAA